MDVEVTINAPQRKVAHTLTTLPGPLGFDSSSAVMYTPSFYPAVSWFRESSSR